MRRTSENTCLPRPFAFTRKVMSAEVTASLPPCTSETTCPCAACSVEGNEEYSAYLIELARAYKEEYNERGSIDISTCFLNMMKKADTKFTRVGREALSLDYDSLEEYIPPESGRVTRTFTSFMSTLEQIEGEGVSVMRKKVNNKEEVLIHNQLHDSLYGSKMIPAFLGVKKGEPSTYYMERVEGPTMKEAMRAGMSAQDLLSTVYVIHSFLGHLRRSFGFVHGDIKFDNIILRGYGEGKAWTVPVYRGTHVNLISLPFLPVLIDFGQSSTYKYSTATQFPSPFPTEMIDVIMLYKGLGSTDENHPFFLAAERIGRVVGGNWRKATAVHPPIPLLVQEVTHESMMALYEQQ